jgi:hypothetical protein
MQIVLASCLAKHSPALIHWHTRQEQVHVQLEEDEAPRHIPDPTLVEHLQMTDEDQRIREADCAERLVPVAGTLPEFELSDAAQFVYDNLFAPTAQNSVVKVPLCTLPLRPVAMWNEWCTFGLLCKSVGKVKQYHRLPCRGSHHMQRFQDSCAMS